MEKYAPAPAGRSGEGEQRFVQALYKRGFVPFPRLLTDYAVELDVNYDILGKLLIVMAALRDVDAVPGSDYRIEEKANPITFADVSKLLPDLAEEELVKYEHDAAAGAIHISFSPLFARLYAIWHQDMEHRRWEAKAPVDHALDARQRQLEEYEPVLRHAEERLGRPLSSRQIDDILEWATVYGFAPEVVRAVIDEGVSRGKTHWGYLRAVGRGWHDLGVQTLADLDQVQANYRQSSALFSRVKRRLSLDRRLTAAEQELVEKWTQQWGFSDEVILKACDATISAKEPTFAYIDRVLEAWREKDVRTAEDAERAVQDFQRGRQNMSRKRDGGTKKGSLSRNFQLPATDRDEDYYEKIIKG